MFLVMANGHVLLLVLAHSPQFDDTRHGMTTSQCKTQLAIKRPTLCPAIVEHTRRNHVVWGRKRRQKLQTLFHKLEWKCVVQVGIAQQKRLGDYERTALFGFPPLSMCKHDPSVFVVERMWFVACGTKRLHKHEHAHRCQILKARLLSLIQTCATEPMFTRSSNHRARFATGVAVTSVAYRSPSTPPARRGSRTQHASAHCARLAYHGDVEKQSAGWTCCFLRVYLSTHTHTFHIWKVPFPWYKITCPDCTQDTLV